VGIGRGVADGDCRWLRHVARAYRWGDARGHHEKRDERLYRALEFYPRRDLRADRVVHARRAGAGQPALMALSLVVGESAPCDCGGGERRMTALAIRGLEKSFGGLRVARAIDLTVEPGERRLIIGPNGAGKTTLFNLIAGEIEPDGGTVAL